MKTIFIYKYEKSCTIAIFIDIKTTSKHVIKAAYAINLSAMLPYHGAFNVL